MSNPRINKGKERVESQATLQTSAFPWVEDVRNAYFEGPYNGDPAVPREAAKKKLADVLKKAGALLGPMGKNNTVFVIQESNKSGIVLMLGIKNPSNDEAYKLLTKNGRPSFLPIVYTSIDHPDSQTSERLKDENDTVQDRLNKAPYRDINEGISRKQVGFVVVMEYLPSKLSDKISDTHKNINASTPPNYAPSMELAANVCTKLSSVLSTLSANGCVMTDLKPENVLFRKNGDLVFADTKSIKPVNQLILKKIMKSVQHVLSDTGEKKVDYEFDTTDAYLSRAAISDKNRDGTSRVPDIIKPVQGRTDAIDFWEKEYSYTMAVMLHSAATGMDPKLNDPKMGDYPDFKFTHPVFSTPEGGRLKEIIEKLSHDDPNQRIHHTQAAKLIASVGNQEQYNKEMQDIKGMSAVIKDIKETQNKPKTPHSDSRSGLGTSGIFKGLQKAKDLITKEKSSPDLGTPTSDAAKPSPPSTPPVDRVQIEAKATIMVHKELTEEKKEKLRQQESFNPSTTKKQTIKSKKPAPEEDAPKRRGPGL